MKPTVGIVQRVLQAQAYIHTVYGDGSMKAYRAVPWAPWLFFFTPNLVFGRVYLAFPV